MNYPYSSYMMDENNLQLFDGVGQLTSLLFKIKTTHFPSGQYAVRGKFPTSFYDRIAQQATTEMLNDVFKNVTNIEFDERKSILFVEVQTSPNTLNSMINNFNESIIPKVFKWQLLGVFQKVA